MQTFNTPVMKSCAGRTCVCARLWRLCSDVGAHLRVCPCIIRVVLDGKYTVFGQVVDGLDVLPKIQEGDVMRKVTLR